MLNVCIALRTEPAVKGIHSFKNLFSAAFVPEEEPPLQRIEIEMEGSDDESTVVDKSGFNEVRVKVKAAEAPKPKKKMTVKGRKKRGTGFGHLEAALGKSVYEDNAQPCNAR